MSTKVPHTRSPVGTPDSTATDAHSPDVLADLQRQIGAGWLTWYGHHTRRWWATPRAPYPWLGLVEGRTPADLLARVREVEAFYGSRRDGARRHGRGGLAGS